MAAGEGYVWSLNQTNGTVSKIDPATMNLLATIEVGVPGTGGDIAAGEGEIWVSARTIPVSRINPATNKVTAQFVGPGGDALRAGNGYVWLSNGRNSNVWRFTPDRLPNGQPPVAAEGPRPARINDRASLKPGSLAERWATGGPNCLTVPDWQVHEYNEDFYILRESGCINAEKPFLYLIFGEDKALLEDTGVAYSTPDHTVISTAPVIMDLLAKWAQRKHHSPVSLIVIHSHSHGDHTAADGQFKAMPGVQFVEAKPEEIQKTAGIREWPTDLGEIDLGKRIIDVIPIPGHDFASIALYDRWTGNLMTGDSLYPGRLYVQDDQIPVYAASAKRLVDFVKIHPVAHVLGTHIEQGSQPYFDYPRGTRYQPKEHVLELSRAHVFELNEAFVKMNGKPIKMVYPDFAVVPRSASVPLPAAIQAGDGLGLQAGDGLGLQAGDGLGLQAGDLPDTWKSGGPNCLTVPDWQVQEYNEDFYILRESGCINPEKPFLYLIFGDDKALLEDTGVARTTPDANGETIIPTASVIMDLLTQWAKRKNHAPVSLVVIHSHAHGDHVAADKQFQGLPNVHFIAAAPAEIQKATGITNWPTDIGHIDLGGRVVDVIPFPGHNDASIALYDRLTGNLMTGDSLYPGLLSLAPEDLLTFTASAKRLADFVSDHLVAHVLGTHIEQKSTPYMDYGRGSIYQPEEHLLELTRAHVFELNEAFSSLHGKLEEVATPDFTIVARGAATAYPPTVRKTE
jgi:glyoxylase-like metal-dependent hydrolase (beta-lactamase superfamily II)